MSESMPSLVDPVSKETTLTYGDLALTGATVFSAISLVCILGLASPGNTLDYNKGSIGPHAVIVRDFIAWTAGRVHLAEGCEERLRHLVQETGWSKHSLTQTSGLLLPNGPVD